MLGIMRFASSLLILAALLGGCVDGQWQSKQQATSNNGSKDVRQYTLKSVTSRAFDTVISPHQPRQSAKFAQFLSTGRVGSMEHFTGTNGDDIGVQIDSAKFRTAGGATCRRTTVSFQLSNSFETRTCTIDGALWYLLRQLHEVGGT